MELIRQQDKNDCGIVTCVMLINHFNKFKTTIEDFKLTHNYKREEYSLENVKNALSKYSIDIDYYQIDSLNNIIEGRSFPTLLVVKNNDGLNHYVLVNKYENDMFEIYDPNYKVKRKLSYKQLNEMSLGIAGFIKEDRSVEEQKLVTKFNRKYFYRFWILFKEEWKIFSLINAITVISLFAFFFSNMFIKVLLTEYAYLTIKRAFLIVSMFIGITTVWVLLLVIQRRLCKWNNQKCLNKYLSYLDDKYNLAKVNTSFNKQRQLLEISNLLTVVNQQLYLINNFIGFSLFAAAVICLTANVSYILLIGTLVLMIVLFLLKIWQAKRNYSNNLKGKAHSNITNQFINSLVEHFETVNQKIKLKDYLELNKDNLMKPSLKDHSLITYLEKISIYLYYFSMIFTLYATGLDVSLFLVVTNITFVFSHQLESILTNINGSFLLNRKLKIINNLKEVDKVKDLPKKFKVTVKKNKMKNNVLRVKKLKDVLINHYPIDKYKESNQLFDTNLKLVDDQAVSNNLFNFGNNNGLDNFSKFKLNEWITKLKIDLSIQTFSLNEEQQEFIKLCSCLFTSKRIMLIKKQKYKWFLLIERDIKKYLTDKLVIVYE